MINGLSSSIPFCVLEDELPQFEVAKNNAIFVTMCHNRHNLAEETSRLRFTKATRIADISVEVAVVSWKQNVGILVAEYHFANLVEVFVVACSQIWRQHSLVICFRRHLKTKPNP